MAQKIWLNGALVPREQASVDVYDHGLLYGDGVFEGIRVYNHRIFKMATHLKRLFDSARAIRLQIPYSPEELAEAMRQTVQACAVRDGYIRLCVTRGIGPLGIDPFKCSNPSVFVIADGIALYPAEYYEKGLAVITASVVRNHPQALSPRIKSMNYLNNIMAKIQAADAGVPEAVMLNHLGYVAECTGDNIFVVRTDEPGRTELLTPPLHAGVLAGVTRAVVMGLARSLHIPTAERDMTAHDLYTADEVFLTGSGAEVVPVIKVDNRAIGRGVPGEMTTRLIDAFRRFVAEDAPED